MKRLIPVGCIGILKTLPTLLPQAKGTAMPELAPRYTAANCNFCCPLQWGLTIRWRGPNEDSIWYRDLGDVLEQDGIRLLGHRYSAPGISQFSVSTQPHVAPTTIVHRVKGRLQYLVRESLPKALQRGYAVRSFGRVRRSVVEDYVGDQLGHHRMADPRIQTRLARFQIDRAEVDLSRPRQGTHGVYWYNLHVVLVHRERWQLVREDLLHSVNQMIVRVCRAKGWLLSRAGILADHVHLVLGCTMDVSPQDVGLCFLNNLSYVHGMRPVFQYGGFLGTVGEYDQGAVVSDIRTRY